MYTKVRRRVLWSDLGLHCLLSLSVRVLSGNTVFFQKIGLRFQSIFVLKISIILPVCVCVKGRQLSKLFYTIPNLICLPLHFPRSFEHLHMLTRAIQAPYGLLVTKVTGRVYSHFSKWDKFAVRKLSLVSETHWGPIFHFWVDTLSEGVWYRKPQKLSICLQSTYVLPLSGQIQQTTDWK